MPNSRFRDAADLERRVRVGEILLPNGTIAATSDFDLSTAMAREAAAV